jgi:hypothetical protein
LRGHFYELAHGGPAPIACEALARMAVAYQHGLCSLRSSETCKLADVPPLGDLADVITRIVTRHPQSRLDELPPWAHPSALAFNVME